MKPVDGAILHGASRDTQTTDIYQRGYALGWLFTALLVFFDWLWISAAGYAVSENFLWSVARAAATILLLAAFLAGIGRIDRYSPLTNKMRLSEIADSLRWVVLLLLFAASCNILQYLSITIGAPSIEDKLAQFDRTLGFDWLEFYNWVRSNPTLERVLLAAYTSFIFQILATPIILGAARRREELSEFVIIFMISEILVLAVSILTPACSASEYFGIPDPNTTDFALLRGEGTRILNPVQGLVSFPSFHTMTAIICAYSLRQLPVVGTASILLNTFMIASTPVAGGHYLVDVLAGGILQVSIIWGFRRTTRWRKEAVKVRVSRARMIGAPIESERQPAGCARGGGE